MDHSETNEINDSAQKYREIALEQADDVLRQLPDDYLDGFNLLGVIANPRGPLGTTTHGRITPNEEAATTSTASTLSYVESTLTTVTEQMEYLNNILEDWSRQILEEDSYYDDAIPESQLKELPAKLKNLNLADLQRFLSQSGPHAQSFSARIANQTESATQSDEEDLDDIPAIFFQSDFDLTDPQTFTHLLLEEEPNVTSNEITHDMPVAEWFPLVPPETFGTQLDKIELALLSQVRAKSNSFFEESVRFAQLQNSINELSLQVQGVMDGVRAIKQDLLEPLQIVPHADTLRTQTQDLLAILDQAQELLRIKASIAGFLSAQDYITAMEQIQYARTLLMPQVTALSNVSGQLTQYQELIVSNLQEELVDIFLSWNNTQTLYAVQVTKATDTARVIDILKMLQEVQALTSTRKSYSARLQDVVRMTTRTIVGEFVADSSVNPASMSLERFLDCLAMIFEQILALLQAAEAVNAFLQQNNIVLDDQTQDENIPLGSVIIDAAELGGKSISELLRLRKESHSLLSIDDMKKLWDSVVGFCLQLEGLSGNKATTLRTTLLGQAKNFCERKHESNMSALVAALDSERFTQCDVSIERQTALTRLCTGRATVAWKSLADKDQLMANAEKQSEAEVEGVRYKVVWSCLLLVEMVVNDIASASYFPSLASNLVGKVTELLRLFNSRTTHLVLGAGAIHSAARLKSINAKHLSLVTQCLGMIMSLLPHIRAAFMSLMPPKQHTLLSELDQVKKEYGDHNEKVLNKFVTIIGGIVEHGLAPKIGGTDFDARATMDEVTCCTFLDGVLSNTKKMHQVLISLLPPDHLIDVFARIYAYIDQNVPTLFIAASEPDANSTPKKSSTKASVPFVFPSTEAGKQRLLLEVETMIDVLNNLDGVHAWDFTAISVLGRKMEYRLTRTDENPKTEALATLEDSEAETADTYETPEPVDVEDTRSETRGESVNDPSEGYENGGEEQPIGEHSLFTDNKGIENGGDAEDVVEEGFSGEIENVDETDSGIQHDVADISVEIPQSTNHPEITTL